MRRGVVRITLECLRRLGLPPLPDSIQILGVQHDFNADVLVLQLTGDGLPEVPEGGHIPNVEIKVFGHDFDGSCGEVRP